MFGYFSLVGVRFFSVLAVLVLVLFALVAVFVVWNRLSVLQCNVCDCFLCVL